MRKYKNKSNACGEIIEQKRLELNLSPSEAVKLFELHGLNIDDVQLYILEKGKIILKDFELLIIANALGIELDILKKDF